MVVGSYAGVMPKVPCLGRYNQSLWSTSISVVKDILCDTDYEDQS